MKKALIAFALLIFCPRAHADIITPPGVWDLLKQRPQTSRPEISLPDPDSPDVASSDAVRGEEGAVSDDIASRDAERS